MRVALGLALAGLLLAGCTQGTYGTNGTTTAPTPYDHSSVVNRDDQFVLTGSVQSFDGDHTYTWHTTRSQFTVNWSGHVSAGSVLVDVKDTLGQPVYSRTYAANSDSSGSEQAQGKLQGDWTVQVTFKGTTGSLSFVMQP